jgi:hypothetical protein
MANQSTGANGSKSPSAPSAAPATKPKKKLVLDINDVKSVLERKISP